MWGRRKDNLRLQDLQSHQMCLVLANQNIFDACDCSGSFEIFLLSVASSHSFPFLSLGCASDLLCHLPQTGSVYSPPGRRAWCRILISLMEVLVCNVGLMLVHTALLSLLAPPEFSFMSFSISIPLDTTNSVLEDNPPHLWLYHGYSSHTESRLPLE